MLPVGFAEDIRFFFSVMEKATAEGGSSGMF